MVSNVALHLCYILLPNCLILRFMPSVNDVPREVKPITLFAHYSNSVNTTTGTPVERMMLSGLHTVTDIFCCCCGQIVGWKYESAHEKSQKYKEGKFVLERGRIVDDVDSSTEFYIDSHVSMSDGEDA
ncbi:hypothetical protein MtrunA17_Chr2g0316891 [Medicago truncatula]|uniref:Protein yippee-like n=1 Tax=Medicago truncatula TaxID=3880 RepID=A0A396J9T9_MEDTR|nr:protein yippee-like At5g53940 [Medicago truncatula]RHN75046.1 hypothetical protein MtrunA17_Chr2g0316891 [Medicago truncatula]